MEKREIKRKAKQILSKYKRMDAAIEKKLKGLGFSIESGRKHYKLYYNGNKKQFAVISKSPSDVKGSRNVASIVCKMVDMEG